VLRNLLSNALKFTEHGRVSLTVRPSPDGWSPGHGGLGRASTVVAFEVADTGIGIPPAKQQIIFEAFQQADGGTSRKYGGTGLGLAISREIARLLGGEIRVQSSPGVGSTFTLYLPAAPIVGPANGGRVVLSPAAASFRRDMGVAALPAPAAVASLPRTEVLDDRDAIRAGDRVALIIEDDLRFAQVLLDRAREQGFRGLVSHRGADALQLARQYRLDAVTLDVELPDINGWQVLSVLKNDPATRHIPVYIISVVEDPTRGLHQGAVGFLNKPATDAALKDGFKQLREFADRQVKRLLVIEDDATQRQSIINLIGSGVETTAVGTGREGLEALREKIFDCVVLDLGLPDMSGVNFLEDVKRAGLRNLPVVVYTAKDMPKIEETELKRMAQTIILKDVRSPERLIEETSLFLHQPADRMPESQRLMLTQAHQAAGSLAGRRVLIVDDDMRNIFAVTSLLERHGVEVVSAETGNEAIDILGRRQDMDLVIMDIMMPEMDGYETMRVIRGSGGVKGLPIIALTAKAMQGDREKCIEAGASDYISKPVDSERLISLLRVWLYR
jgi:CheY-like chemotaxis protein